MIKNFESVEKLFEVDSCAGIKNNTQRLAKFIELDKESLELDIKSGVLSKKDIERKRTKSENLYKSLEELKEREDFEYNEEIATILRSLAWEKLYWIEAKKELMG